MEPIRFNCPHCGAHLKVLGSTAGRQCKCSKCGKTVTIPVLDLIAAVEDDSLTPQPTPVAAKSRNLPGRTPVDRRRIPKVFVIAGIICALLLGIAAVGLWYDYYEFDFTHRDEILTLKKKAEFLRDAGQFREAGDAFIEIQRMGSGRAKTASLAAAIQEAAREQDQMVPAYKAMLDKEAKEVAQKEMAAKQVEEQDEASKKAVPKERHPVLDYSEKPTGISYGDFSYSTTQYTQNWLKLNYVVKIVNESGKDIDTAFVHITVYDSDHKRLGVDGSVMLSRMRNGGVRYDTGIIDLLTLNIKSSDIATVVFHLTGCTYRGRYSDPPKD